MDSVDATSDYQDFDIVEVILSQSTAGYKFRYDTHYMLASSDIQLVRVVLLGQFYCLKKGKMFIRLT